MSKNKSKKKVAQPGSNEPVEDKTTEEMMKMQYKLAKLQEGMDCLLGYLVKKNIVSAAEFKAFILDEFKVKLRNNIANGSLLQGSVSIIYYDRESMEVLQ